MKPSLSEFSFGFALLNELIAEYPITLTSAPSFPTQNEEGKVGGYDVKLPKLGMPVFLQFKRSDCMVGGNSKEAYIFGVPYYRMHLRPRTKSLQHRLLLDVEQAGHEVYYVAPRFHQMGELDEAYSSKQVTERSTFIRPSFIGPLKDDHEHYVAIGASGVAQRFCSDEPRQMRTIGSRELFEDYLIGKLQQKRMALTEEGLLKLGDSLVDLHRQRTPRQSQLNDPRVRSLQTRDERSPSEYVQEVSQMLFGCQLAFMS